MVKMARLTPTPAPPDVRKYHLTDLLFRHVGKTESYAQHSSLVSTWKNHASFKRGSGEFKLTQKVLKVEHKNYATLI